MLLAVKGEKVQQFWKIIEVLYTILNGLSQYFKKYKIFLNKHIFLNKEKRITRWNHSCSIRVKQYPEKAEEWERTLLK